MITPVDGGGGGVDVAVIIIITVAALIVDNHNPNSSTLSEIRLSSFPFLSSFMPASLHHLHYTCRPNVVILPRRRLPTGELEAKWSLS